MAKRVFIVDDSMTARQSVRSLLEERGYDVIEAINGIDAEGRIGRHDIDLLITDYEMPGMNGIELARSVRQMEGKSFLPILVLSSNKEVDKKVSEALDVAGWLDKGRDMTRLPTLVNLLIGS